VAQGQQVVERLQLDDDTMDQVVVARRDRLVVHAVRQLASEAQRAAILTALDAEAQEGRRAKGDAHTHFFERMKFLTVYGYCTSEVGATAELHYEVIPGSFDGCTELGRWRAGPGSF